MRTFLKSFFFNFLRVKKSCGFESKEAQSGATIQRLGSRFTLNVTRPEDLNRTVVKSDSASVLVPHLDFEIPAGTQQGSLNTIEGILETAAAALAQLQPQRREMDAAVAAKVDVVIEGLHECAEARRLPFVIVVDDPAGNSFIQNPHAPKDDPELTVANYARTREQNEQLCLNDTEAEAAAASAAPAPVPAPATTGAPVPQKEQEESYLSLVPQHKVPTAITEGLPVCEDKPTVTQEQEVVMIPENCPSCSAQGEVRSVLTKIPHFKEVVIMAFACERCGYKSNEVHASGAVAGYGTKTTLHVKSPLDMTRSFLKSETATLAIPDLQLELGTGTLGSRFTTIEGIIDNIIDALSKNPFVLGDSAERSARQRLNELTIALAKLKSGATPFTLVVDDPMSNSYIQNPLAPAADPQLDIVNYDLTWAQKEELGINDMRTDYDSTSRQYLAPTISHHGGAVPAPVTTAQAPNAAPVPAPADAAPKP